MAIRFDGKVVIVTGAGGGLGKQHALEFARRGAKVVVNDLGGSVDGTGGNSAAAEAVVAEIKAAGGEAMANGASVTDDAGVAHLVKQTMDAWGRSSRDKQGWALASLAQPSTGTRGPRTANRQRVWRARSRSSSICRSVAARRE